MLVFFNSNIYIFFYIFCFVFSFFYFVFLFRLILEIFHFFRFFFSKWDYFYPFCIFVFETYFLNRNTPFYSSFFLFSHKEHYYFSFYKELVDEAEIKLKDESVYFVFDTNDMFGDSTHSELVKDFV